MYCKHCGKETNKDGLYCTNCGAMLKENTDDFKVKGEKIEYCNNCGNKIRGNYCTSCGTQGYKYTVKSSSVSKVIGDTDISIIKNIIDSIKKSGFKDITQNIKDKKFMKELLIHTGTALIIGLILCLIINVSFFGSFNEEMKVLIAQIKTQVPNANIRLNINPLDIYGFSFLNTYKINYSGLISFQNDMKDTMTLKFSFSLLVLLIIPILSFLGVGFKKYKNESTTRSSLKLYLYSSILYSLLLNIIFLFNRKAFDISTSVFGKIEVNIRGGFTFFGSLVTVFILSFIVQLLLSMFIKKESPKDVLSHLVSENKLTAFVNIVKLGFIYSLGLCILFGLLGMLGIMGPGIQELCKKPAVLLFVPNIIIYIYLFTFGNTFNIVAGSEFIKHGVIRSSFEGFLIGNISTVYGLMFMNILIVLGMAIILYIAVKKLPREDYFKHLAVFSGMVALFNFMLATYSNFQVSAKGDFKTLENVMDMLGANIPITPQGSLYIGTSLLMSFVISYIFVFVIGMARYYLEDKKQLLILENFFKSYKKQILIAAPIVLFIVSLLSFKMVIDRGVTKNTFTEYEESRYEEYSDNKTEDLIDTEEIRSLHFAGDNSYIFNTWDEIYLFNINKHKITKLLETDESIEMIFPSYDYDKIAVLYYSEEYLSIKVIDIKGTEIFDKKDIGYPNRIEWSPDSKMLLLEGDSNSIINLEKKEMEILGVPGYNLAWKDSKNIAYLKDGQVYEYNMEKNESVSTDKTAREIMRKGDKTFIIGQVANEEGVVQSEYIEEINGEMKIEFEGSILNFDSINNGDICIMYGSLFESEEIEEGILLIKKKGENGYEDMEHNIRAIYSINHETNEMIVKRMGSDDFFQVNLEKGIWNNVTLEIISLQRLMEEGER